MDDELLKLECLKVAIDKEGLKGSAATARAQEIFDWTKGRGQTDTVGEGQAKVVGRDGKLEKPFSDYLGKD
jgi:hypothetical protein